MTYKEGKIKRSESLKSTIPLAGGFSIRGSLRDGAIQVWRKKRTESRGRVVEETSYVL